VSGVLGGVGVLEWCAPGVIPDSRSAVSARIR
jgi:hypothetical protein